MFSYTKNIKDFRIAYSNNKRQSFHWSIFWYFFKEYFIYTGFNFLIISYKRKVTKVIGQGFAFDYQNTLKIFWIPIRWKSGYHYDN